MNRRVIIFHDTPMDAAAAFGDSTTNYVVVSTTPLQRHYSLDFLDGTDLAFSTGPSGRLVRRGLRALGLGRRNTGRWVEVLLHKATGGVRIDRGEVGACASAWERVLGTDQNTVYLRPISPVERYRKAAV